MQKRCGQLLPMYVIEKKTICVVEMFETWNRWKYSCKNGRKKKQNFATKVLGKLNDNNSSDWAFKSIKKLICEFPNS